MNRHERRKAKKLNQVVPPQSSATKEQLLLAQAFEYYQQKKTQAAIDTYLEIFRMNPENATALFYLGVISSQVGATERALQLLSRSLELAPDNAEAWLHLGNLHLLTNPTEAEKYYAQAIYLDPRLFDAYLQLGTIYRVREQYEDAIAIINAVLELETKSKEALRSLAFIYTLQGKTAIGIETAHKILTIDQNYAPAHALLGMLYLNQGVIAKSLYHYRLACKLDHTDPVAHSGYLFAMHSDPTITQKEIYDETLNWAARHASSVTQLNHTNDPNPTRRLRIGYVSADLWQHAVVQYFEPVLKSHDASAVEIFCYSNNAKSDAVTARLQSYGHHWRNITALSDRDAAKQIQEDKIDILIDLSGHTVGNRLAVFARKPAPIQATWIGYFNTTGVKAIDYFITNRFLLPPEDEPFYIEKPLRLPNSSVVYKPYTLPIEVSALPALTNGYITFGCFNSLSKVAPEVIKLWAEILHKVPNSRLYLKNKAFDSEATRKQYQDYFSELGIDSKRLLLSGSSPIEEYLRSYRDVDLGLDPFPYNGATTTLDSLWMGVPIITLKGDRIASRYGESWLGAVGLQEFVASSKEQYVEKAVAMANNLQHLAEVRGSLRQILTAAPVTNPVLFTQGLEKAFRDIWKEWCGNAEPTHSPPNDPNAHLQLGSFYRTQKRFAEAEQSFGEVLKLDPKNYDALQNLASLFEEMGRFEEASGYYQKAGRQAMAIGHPDRHTIAGIACGMQSDWIGAIEHHQLALSLHPNNPQLLSNLAGAYDKANKITEAEKLYLQAIAIKPDLWSLYFNLGNLYQNQNFYDLAISAYAKAIELNPKSIQTFANLAVIYNAMDDLTKALEHIQHALSIEPNYVEAYSILGQIYRNQGRFPEALEQYRRVCKLQPSKAWAHSSYLFILHYDPDTSTEEIYRETLAWADRHVKNIPQLSHSNEPNPTRRLRIGYVSADFCRHPLAFYIEPVLSSHDKSQVEIFCYANRPKDDEVTARLQTYADHWRNISRLSDDAAARLIQEDKIDILVDLSGHTGANRLLLFARKPAPIQATWIGYFNTTGVKAIDYIITDRFLVKPEDEHLYVEKPLRLPNSSVVFKAHELPIEVNTLPALSNGFVTFGCFNALTKLTPEVIGLWAEILKSIPNAKLYLKNKSFSDLAVCEDYSSKFAVLGVNSTRLKFFGFSPALEYLESYHDVDLGLDPFPYNGATTTLDSLWMGVPMITLRGDRIASRYSESWLGAVGLQEFVASSKEQYVEKAVAMANNLQHLAEVRRSLRQTLTAAPITNPLVFTQGLEEAFRNIWKEWCQKVSS